MLLSLRFSYEICLAISIFFFVISKCLLPHINCKLNILFDVSFASFLVYLSYSLDLLVSFLSYLDLLRVRFASLLIY